MLELRSDPPPRQAPRRPRPRAAGSQLDARLLAAPLSHVRRPGRRARGAFAGRRKDGDGDRAKRVRASPPWSTTGPSTTSPSYSRPSVAAAGISLENGRLQAELRARLVELKGSRARRDRGRSKGAPAPGAQPPRRRAATADRPLAPAQPPRAEAGRAARDLRRELDQARREIALLARGAPRCRPRHPPRGPDGTRPGSRARVAGRPGALPGPAHGRPRPAASGEGRSGGLLRRLREPHEHRQARGGAGRERSGREDRLGDSWSRSSTTASAAPIPKAGRGSAGSRTASRPSVAASASGRHAAAARAWKRRSRARSDRRGQRAPA